MTLKIALGCIQPQQNQLLRPRSSFLEHTSVLVYISWKAHHNVAPCFQIECASHCEVQQRDHKTLYRVCMMSVFTLFTNPELCFRCEKRWNERSDFFLSKGQNKAFRMFHAVNSLHGSPGQFCPPGHKSCFHCNRCSSFFSSYSPVGS